MIKVVISKKIHPKAMALLEGKVRTAVMPDSEVSTAKEMLADADALILRTNIKITDEIIADSPKLRIISRTGVGVDNVDVEAATARGIMVCNTPGVNSVSVAEQALALIMATAKRIGEMDKAVREGNWSIRNTYAARDLDGMTLGLVGIGQIGSLVAQKCRAAFNMKTIAYDPYVKSADGMTLVENMEEVFSSADIVSLHVPYTKQTHHLINKQLLDLMKPDAVLINTARGPIVDETALADALAEGQIAGAGLDVFSKEPPELNNPLFKHPNVITSPHSAALSRECVEKVAVVSAEAIASFASGKTPQFVFNAKEIGING